MSSVPPTAASKPPLAWLGGALVLGAILSCPCGVGIGWTIGHGTVALKESPPATIEGVYVRTKKGEPDSRIERLEFKANGVVMINDDRKMMGTYRYNKGAVVINPGAFEMIGEVEGRTLRMRQDVFVKQ